MLSYGEDCLKTEVRFPGLLMLHKYSTVEYCPYGIIGVIIPWNFPIHNALSAIIAAIFSGNGAVVKVSEWASWSCAYLENMMNALFKATGHNPDLIQFVTGFGEAGSAVVANTDKVLFIGSPQVGKKVMETASQTLTPVTLELGGKDPLIICEDAPLDHAINMSIWGSFFNCGQNCVSVERCYVFDAVYDKFIEEAVKRAKGMRQGADGASRCDIGAVNLPSQLQKYQDMLDDALKKGAKILLGGSINKGLNGHFFQPTIIVNVNHSMKIVQEELFGPVLCVIRVSSDEELLRLVNDCQYGLSCSIFTKNRKRGLRLARNIQSGMSVVNDWGLGSLIQSLPFGGVKLSGFGRFNGPEGLRDFCYQKTHVTDRFPFIVTPPKPLVYPVSQNAHLLVDEFIKIYYGRSLLQKVQAAFALVKRIVTGKI